VAEPCSAESRKLPSNSMWEHEFQRRPARFGRFGGRAVRCACAVVLFLGLAACRDTPVEPTALLVAAETEAALQVAADLPTLPTLVAAVARDGTLPAGLATALQQATHLWLEAEGAADSAASAEFRTAAYALAVPALVAGLADAELARADSALDRWLRTADRILTGRTPLEIGQALRDGREHLDRAREATAGGERALAVEATLRAADRLLETTPRAVALRLIREAELELEVRRVAAGASGPDASTRRAERLVRGARQALAEEAFPLAIRRAYYAGQLLESR
jgi:hypothetical protein